MPTELRQYQKHSGIQIDGKSRYMVTTFGFDVKFANRNKQTPYFAITADVWGNEGRFNAGADIYMGGCLHDLIARQYSKSLAPLIRWHLTGADGVPMHYAANAAYWAYTALGYSQYPTRSYDPDPLEAFKHTVVFGAVEGDTLPACLSREPMIVETESVKKMLRAEVTTEISVWCEARRPALNTAFLTDMRAAGLIVDVPEVETV